MLGRSKAVKAAPKKVAATQTFTMKTLWRLALWGATAASYNIGKLASVSSLTSDGTCSESYTYDSKGRPSDATITIPGGGTNAFITLTTRPPGY